tara:strand:+ start:1452 stop:1910 length:459 start_codon:yes stop_codon:yes gene_type:complete
MKKLLTEWRKFLSEGTVKYSDKGGILKIKPSHIIISELEALQGPLPEEAGRLSEEDLHITLIHQSILKPFHEQIKNMELPIPPPINLDDEVWERESLDKKSWAVRLVNQDEMREYVGKIMELLGSPNLDPEPERVFHISLANLTGKPQDSVR